MRMLTLCLLGLGLALVACQSTQGPDNRQNRAPTATFTASSLQGAAPLSVSFDASASTDADGSIATYHWNFGDGATASGAVTSHTYDAGSFTVVLTVTDDGGLTATDSTTIEVQEEGAPGAGEEARATAATHALAEAAPFLPDTLLSSAVDIALAATQLSGSDTLVASGTVTQTGADRYSYDPAPSDRLRAVLLDGREFEVVFSVLQGDFSGDGGGFMAHEHRASAQVSSNAAAGSLDLSLQSVKLDGSQGRTVQGTLTDESGVRWALDVRVEGTYLSEVDIGTARRESDDLVQGTLQAEVLGVSATLGKRYVYKMLNGVENVRHLIDRGWTWNGSAYRLQLEVFVAFDEAQPVDTDQWIIQGGLARDGAAIAQVQAADDATGLDIWLALGAERVPLFRFDYL